MMTDEILDSFRDILVEGLKLITKIRIRAGRVAVHCQMVDTVSNPLGD